MCGWSLKLYLKSKTVKILKFSSPMTSFILLKLSRVWHGSFRTNLAKIHYVLDVLSASIDWQFKAQYKAPRSMLPTSAEFQPQQASWVKFLGNDTFPYHAPTRLDGIWGSLWCSLVLNELAFAEWAEFVKEQAKLHKSQTIMNEYVSFRNLLCQQSMVIKTWMQTI